MADDSPTINLKILSPSTEVEGGITFPNLSATTTIRELRGRIQDAVPSKPAPERMRLIYRGRVVAVESDTLGNVFGADNIRESKDQSLHLVLRELPHSSTSSSPAPRSSTAPPNPFRPARAPIPASPPLQTNPFRTLPQPRPSSQPQAPPPHHHHHHHHPHPHVHHHHMQGPPNPFQIPLPPAIQQQLAQTMNMAQNGQMNPGQAPSTHGQPSREGTPAPPMGLPPLPGFGPPALPPNGRTVRQEGIGPNGERWSVTYSSANVPIGGGVPVLPRPVPTPTAAGFPLPFGLPPRPGGSPTPTEAIDRLLPRMRGILQSARQEMENVTTLLQTSGHNGQPNPLSLLSAPSWRLERMRQHVQMMGQNLNLVERGLAVIAADASMTDNPDVLSLRQEANALRAQLEEMNRTIGHHTNQAPSTQSASPTSLPGASATAPIAQGAPATSQLETQASTQTLPPGFPEELFILSSPQGPVGILFDQRGTYATAPLVPTLPFPTFTNQFAQNRQLIAGLGQQIAHGSSNFNNQLASIQPTPTQQSTATEQTQNQVQPDTQGAEQGQAQNQPQGQVQNANPPANPPGENDRVGNIAGHLWLLFKLACFVYFFSGGGGWYKSLTLGLIAGGVYLAQLGLFDEHFGVIRQHFEAILPVGALAERAAQPRNAAPPGRNMTPEEAARRLLQQQRDQRFSWIRESMRTVERSFAIFVASLWPGIGERMVHAQEERVRLERVAEEERQRQIEESQRQEAEAKEKSEAEKDAPAAEGTAASAEGSSSAKGKEKADGPDTDVEVSGELSGATS